jgi:hemolysin activation/secretion protein
MNATVVHSQMRPDAGTLLQEQQRNQPRALERLTPGEVEKERPPLQETGIKFLVRGFRFSGNEGIITDADLNNLLKDAVGQEIGLTGLRRLAERVTKYLHKKGWFLARAYIPQQEIKDGIVEIAIIAGKIEGKAVIRGQNLRMSEEILRKMVEPSTTEGGAVKQQDLTRDLLLMNDLPGIHASSTLEPGEAEGTAKVVVDTSEGPLLSGRLWGDNYGDRFTGEYRGNGLLQLNDPFRYGDQVTLSTTDNYFYQYGQANYTFPILYNGLRAGFVYSEMRYKLDPDLVTLDVDGGSRVAGTTLAYPIIRSRTLNLWTGADYYYKNLWDNAIGVKLDDKVVNVGGVHLYGDMLDTLCGGGYTTFSAGLNGGDLDLSRVQANLEADAQTAKSDGAFGKFTFGASRLQKIYGDLNFFLSLNGQIAFDNLDTSEKFLLGGPYGVRAYPVGEAPGDSGGVLTSELRYDFREIKTIGFPQLVGFFDLGWTELHNSPWANSGTPIGNRNSYAISGGGFGLNLNKPNVYSIRLAWAVEAGSNPGRTVDGKDADGKSDSNRYWLQVMASF